MNNELYHYGVPGMKWGVRRYQNKDGSLTAAGKKHIGKQYEKTAKKVTAKLGAQYNSMYVKSYNKAADDMNRGGIDKFNAEQRKKYGENYTQRDGYMSDYQKTFDKRFNKYMNTSLNDFYKNDKNFQKCEKLVKQYDMTEWNELAKKNAAAINDLRQTIEREQHDD